ncbi:hypothetical protein GCM10008924_31700 [Gracilibacillus halotolerans]
MFSVFLVIVMKPLIFTEKLLNAIKTNSTDGTEEIQLEKVVEHTELITRMGIVASITAIVAIILFHKPYKPKIAGGILFIVGITTTIISFSDVFYASIFFIIAGVLGLRRKDKIVDDSIEKV